MMPTATEDWIAKDCQNDPIIVRDRHQRPPYAAVSATMSVSGHLFPSCSLVQHVWFTPKNGNAGEQCTTEKKCHERT